MGFIILLFISNLSMFEKEVAMEILRGQRVVVVRCELLNMSGSLFRKKLEWEEFLNKANNTNPRRQFKHYRSPSRMFWRIVRGMLPHKTPKGKAALQPLKVVRLKAHRNFCVFCDLAQMAGWTKKELVATLEEKRKVKSQKFFETKTKKAVAKKKAVDDKSVAKVNAELKALGF